MYRTVLTIMLLVLRAICCNGAIVTVTVTNYSFTPAMFTINPGDTVKWVWLNGHHNTTPVSRPVGAATWYADFSAGNTSFTYVPTVSGLYRYTCTYHSGMDGQFFVTGCSFPAKPVISSVGGNAVCAGDTVLLQTTLQPGVSYEWSRDWGTILQAVGSEHPATINGIYRVTVNACGVDSVSDPFQVTVYALPQPGFTYSHNGLLKYTFNNTTGAINANSYIWSFGDGSPDQVSVNAQHVYTAPGLFTVQLKATDNTTTCIDSISAIIQASLKAGMSGKRSYAIFPNPASGHIRLITDERLTFQVTNLQGKVLALPFRVDKQGIDINVGRLSPGLYLLHIHSANGSVTEKISIE